MIAPRRPVTLYIHADKRGIVLPADCPAWLQFKDLEQVEARLSRVHCFATDNPEATRRALLDFTVDGHAWPTAFVQQPGLLVQTEQIRVLNTPLTVDMLVLVTYAAQKISDIKPLPIQLIVTMLAVLALIALGLIAALLRRVFVDVPEPAPLSTDTLGQPVVIVPGVRVQSGLPLQGVAVEEQTIALQTVKAVYWLLRQIK